HRHPPLLGDVLALGVLQQPGRAVAAAHARVLHAATGVVDGRPCGRVAVVDGDGGCADLRGDAAPRIAAGDGGGVATVDGVVGGIDRSHQVVNDLDEDDRTEDLLGAQLRVGRNIRENGGLVEVGA